MSFYCALYRIHMNLINIFLVPSFHCTKTSTATFLCFFLMCQKQSKLKGRIRLFSFFLFESVLIQQRLEIRSVISSSVLRLSGPSPGWTLLYGLHQAELGSTQSDRVQLPWVQKDQLSTKTLTATAIRKFKETA